jgi:ferredoxin
MPRVTIDCQSLEVADGTTILEAARQLGIEIPTLCYLRGYEPSTSCQVCLVKDRRRSQLVPACATHVTDGMEIDSETEEVRQVRRTALELLFSDHVGDCLAPCFFACPAHMDIPLMLEQIGEHDLERAIATVKQEIALPAILGRVCSKPCEKGCRRHAADEPVSVCELKRFVADVDLARARPYLPDRQPPSGKRVAIVGAGPSGLSAAYYLQQSGHECVLFEKEAAAGGRLRTEASPAELPPSVLQAEVEQVLRLGAQVQANTPVDDLDRLQREFDAVLLACGPLPPETSQQWGVRASARGVEVDRDTLQTSRAGVFAAGSVLRKKSLFVRSVADGKLAATAMHQYLSGQPITPPARPFSTRVGTLSPEEAGHLSEAAGQALRIVPGGGQDYTADAAAEQADRCFSCGCIGHGSCRLERYAIEYGADPTRFAGVRKPVEVVQRPGGVRFEPHKCIKCELCIQIAARAGEPLGLTFVGRGFDMELSVPLGGSIDDGLTKAAAECVAACPTGALSFARHHNPQAGSSQAANPVSTP